MSAGPAKGEREEKRRNLLLAEKKADISARLERICQGMPRDEFDRLVEQIALVEIKYLVRRSDDLFPGVPPHPPPPQRTRRK